MEAVKEPPKPSNPEEVQEIRERRPSKKSKDDKTSRKKDERTLEQVLKTLNNLGTPAEKFEALCNKYTELLDENKRQQLSVKVTEKKCISLQREKEQLQGEQTKSVASRSRLEQLCRELQRQNKVMKEESLQRIREEEERRKEVSSKFHATLAEITALMQQNTDSNSKLRDENLQMQNQFKGVCEQYELREQQVEKISKQMKLEGQLADAKLAKAKLELQAQKEILEKEKAELMAEVAMCQRKCLDHEKTEEALRAQINVYFEKYDEFQSVLTKSNQVYSGFKTEMEKMSKKITRLEKETSTWKQKWESTHRALLALAAEKQAKDAEVALQVRQLAQLQKLCRTLQSERMLLLRQLDGAGITPKLKADGSEDVADKELLENTSVPTSDASGEPKEATRNEENWKTKWEKISTAYEALSTEKKVKEEEMSLQADKLHKLETLVHSLEQEMSSLRSQLSQDGKNENSGQSNASATATMDDKTSSTDPIVLAQAFALEVESIVTPDLKETDSEKNNLPKKESATTPDDKKTNTNEGKDTANVSLNGDKKMENTTEVNKIEAKVSSEVIPAFDSNVSSNGQTIPNQNEAKPTPITPRNDNEEKKIVNEVENSSSERVISVSSSGTVAISENSSKDTLSEGDNARNQEIIQDAAILEAQKNLSEASVIEENNSVKASESTFSVSSSKSDGQDLLPSNLSDSGLLNSEISLESLSSLTNSISTDTGLRTDVSSVGTDNESSSKNTSAEKPNEAPQPVPAERKKGKDGGRRRKNK